MMRSPLRLLRPTCDARTASLATVASVTVGFGCFYGAVMGMYGGLGLDRLRQIAYSATKVPILLGLTLAICLPSFFVLNTLLGLRGDFARVIRLLVTTQAIVAIVLASLAPFTALWYVSFTDHDAAILFNGFMFAIASVTAQVALRRQYQPLIEKNPRHSVMNVAWLILYVFVGTQLAWTLRPYVGAPELPTEFFREDGFTNAYVAIARMFVQ